VKPVTPPHPHPGAVHVVFAANQPEYDQLPAVIDAKGLAMTEFELSAEDLATIVNGGRIRLWIWTFRQPLQPVALEVVE